MNMFMVSTGSCRANAHNLVFSQQIGAFQTTMLPMILSAYPTPQWSMRRVGATNEGHMWGKCLLARQKRLSCTCRIALSSFVLDSSSRILPISCGKQPACDEQDE